MFFKLCFVSKDSLYTGYIFCFVRHNEQSPSKNGRKSNDARDYLSISNNCLRSPESGIHTGGAYRKKKPAPLPPNKKESVSDQRTSSMSKLQSSSPEYRVIYDYNLLQYTTILA